MIFPTKEGDWKLPEEKAEEWKETYPNKDIDNELLKARQWLRDNKSRQKTKRGMTRYLGAWLSNAPESFKPKPAKPIVQKERQWFAQCGDWLRYATLLEISGNNSFKALLSDPEFKAWACRINPLVKEI